MVWTLLWFTSTILRYNLSKIIYFKFILQSYNKDDTITMSQEQGIADFFTRQDELLRKQNRLLEELIQSQKNGGPQVDTGPPELRIDGEDVIGQGEDNRRSPPSSTWDNAEFIAVPGRSPGTASRILLKNGRNILDFSDGTIDLGDGSSDKMSSGLSQKKEDALWSLFMWVDNDCTVQVNTPDGDLSEPFFIDQCTYVIIENWPFDKIVIEPKGNFDIRVYAIGGTFPNVPFGRLPITSHQERQVTGFETSSEWQTVKTMHLMNFLQKGVHIENTGSESVDVRVRKKHSGKLNFATVVDRLAADNDAIAAGDHFIYDTQEPLHVINVQVKNGSGQTTIDFEAIGVS